jgi:hypothetical protein
MKRARGEQASGEQASGEQASGEQASGEQASGEQARQHGVLAAQRLDWIYKYTVERLSCRLDLRVCVSPSLSVILPRLSFTRDTGNDLPTHFTQLLRLPITKSRESRFSDN